MNKNIYVLVIFIKIFNICAHFSTNTPSQHSSCWRGLEDVLTTSFVFVFRRSLQGVSKTSWLRQIYSLYSYVLIKTNIYVLDIRLQDVFKTSSRSLAKTSSRYLQDVFKMSCKNVFKTSSRRFQDALLS